MQTLEFCVLGPLQVRSGGRVVELGPDRRRTILAALVVDVGRVVAFDTLVERVWGEGTPNKPMASVHTYVSRLRTALRSSADQPPPLLTEPPGYRLAVEPESVDAVRFEMLLRRAEDCRRDGDARQARELVGQALQLWRGPAYLDVRAAFAEAEAARLGAARARAEELQVSLELDLGHDEAVLPRLTALVAAEPLREKLQGALMLSLYRTGDQAEALRRYGEVRALLADELGVDPSPELRELHARMLRQDPTLDRPPAPGPPRVAVSAPSLRALPMVGRQPELDRACRTIERAWTTGDTVTLAVVGEAGIGKSRLLEEVASWAAARSALVAWGRSWQHDGAPPLWPWIQIVESIAESLSDDVLTECLRDRAAAVRSLVPHLPGEAAPAAAEPGTSIAQSQVRQFAAVTAFFENVGARRPLLLVVEDLHWADPASRQLAEFLTANTRSGSVALMLSVRSPVDDAGAAGSDLLGALARGDRCERVALSGLTADDVRAYVHDRTEARLDDATARTLVERTSGNPFFVGEIVRLLVTDRRSEPGSPLPDEVPETVREVILHRVRRLPGEHQAVLRAAAVLGGGFDLGLLEQVSRLDADVVDEAVDTATATGFLCAEPGRTGRHRFTHALAQQAIDEDIGPARRARLHSRAAVALRARAGADSLDGAEDIVHHLLATGLAEDLDPAVELMLRLADAATGRGNYPQAELVLLRAEEVVRRLPGAGSEAREMSVLIRLYSLYDVVYGPAMLGSSRESPAVAARRRAVELARRLAGGHDLLVAVYGAWTLAIGTSQFAAAFAAVDEMRLLAEADDDEAMRTVMHQTAGLTLTHQGRLAAAEEHLTAAIAGCARIDTIPLAAVLSGPVETAWGWRAVVRLMLGRPAEAAADLAVLAELAEQENRNIAVNTSGCAAVAAAVADRPAEAADWAERCLSHARPAGLMAVSTYIAVVGAWARERVRPGSSLGELRAALELLSPGDAVLMRPYLRGLFVDVAERTGDPALIDEATAVLDSALAETAATGNDIGLPGLHALRARLLRRRGDQVAAAAAERQARDTAAAQGSPGFPYTVS